MGRCAGDRNGRDTSLSGAGTTAETGRQFPELAELATLAPGTVLDGEIVVMSGGDRICRPSSRGLQDRPRHGCSRSRTLSLISSRGEEDLTALPLLERREILKSVPEGPHVVISVPVEGGGRTITGQRLRRALKE